jgi:PIN domain nuclease of toxin-antitoxin system
MRYLLDTHAFIWFITNDDRLGSRAYEEVSNIKKLELGKPFHALIPRELVVNEIGLLSIVPKHLAALADLPFHHRDPFDRLIIAQAMIEGIPIVSHDGDFPQYPVQIVW